MKNKGSDEYVLHLWGGSEKLTLTPPEGDVFKECIKCQSPFLCPKDEDIEKCICCLINEGELVNG